VELAAGQAGSIPITVTGPFSVVGPPTGTITYSVLNAANTSVASGSLPLTAGTTDSTATVPIAGSLASGDYTVSITYSGDTNYAVSSAPIIIQLSVGKIAPTISWAPPVTIITYGATLSSILNASASDGSTAVAGSFTYTATLQGGSAVAVTGATVLNPGQYTLTATFTPTDSSTYISATASAALTVKDFVLNVPTGGSTSATVLPGGTATYALAFAPSTGTTFPSAVTLTASGAPAGAIVTITPQTIPAGSGPTNVALTVQVPLAAVASLRQKNQLALQASTLMFGMFLLPFGGIVRRAANRQGRKLKLLSLALGVVVLMGLSGCGSRDSGFFASPQKNYTITVTATSGSISHATTLTLTVR
jgi:hypothetical protein